MDMVLEQVKRRRKELGLKQHDMFLRVGISRQQYQQIESKGNPRLDTLQLISVGLKGEVMFIPQEKLSRVRAVLDDEDAGSQGVSRDLPGHSRISDDPWRGVLDVDE